jgi:hypothetical protein
VNSQNRSSTSCCSSGWIASAKLIHCQSKQHLRLAGKPALIPERTGAKRQMIRNRGQYATGFAILAPSQG